MSALRHAFKIVVDNGEPIKIVTSARDMAAVDEDDSSGGQTWALIHAACLRLKVPGIPDDLDTFIDLLDELEDLEGGVPIGHPANPIQPPASAG